MTWIIFSLVLGVVAIVAIVGSFGINTGEGAAEDADSLVFGARMIGGACIVLFVAWTAWSMFQQVGATSVGVQRSFGHVSPGSLGPGAHVIAPWADVSQFDTKVKTMAFDDGRDGSQPAIAAFSKETQNAQVRVSVNYHVDPADVRKLYLQVGQNFVGLIPARVNQVVKDETVKFNATDLAPHREDLRQAVRDRLGVELAPYSIKVDDVNITNISFSPQFEAAIEAKQEATQATLKAQQEILTAKAKADAAVKTADGQADVVRAAASGQADANRDLNASLSAAVLQYLTIQKLSDNVQIMLLPSDGNSLFQLPALKAVTTP